MRIRNALTQATYAFFQENGFIYVQVPIITTTDCEGIFDHNFQVTTLLDTKKTEDQRNAEDIQGVKLETIQASINEKSKQVEELKRSASNKEALAAAIHDLKKTNELVLQLQAKENRKSTKSMQISTKDDFFSCKTYLTCSGRLHLESYASALGNVYSVGPRFRANRAESKKSLAEMWNVDVEMAFSQIDDSMECAVDFLKFMCKWILENCTEDLKFVSKRVDKLVVDRLQLITIGPFEKISYTEAVEALKQVIKLSASTQKKQKKSIITKNLIYFLILFPQKNFDIEWGVALSEAHER